MQRIEKLQYLIHNINFSELDQCFPFLESLTPEQLQRYTWRLAGWLETLPATHPTYADLLSAHAKLVAQLALLDDEVPL